MLRILVALVLILVAAPARADLMTDAQALEAAWQRPGSAAKRLAPVFLHDGETRLVPFVDARTDQRSCMTITAIAERHVRFTLTSGAADEPVESRAGVARLTDCERGSLTLPEGKRRVALTMQRGRGAIEIVRAVYATQLTPVDVVLPERAVGPVGLEATGPGAQVLAPMALRVARARRSAHLDGAHTIVPRTVNATESGAGSVLLRLAAGCHRLHVVADTGLEGAADVDADARRHDDGVVLVRDRSHAPDARLELCVGVDRRIEVRFNGAPPKSDVALLDAFWPIPAGIPATWGARAREGLAWAVHRRHSPAPEQAPLFESLGVPGVTMLPVPVVPGACYLAAFALARGEAATSRLSARVGKWQGYDDANDLVRSAALTFCAGPSAEVARLRFDIRSRDAWWVAMVWRVGGDHGP